jgi:hypothetical protein
MIMETQGRWKVLLNECKGKKVRLILSSLHLRYLLYATVRSENADRIVSIVSSRNWSCGQLMTLLSSEAEYVLSEVL